MKNLFFTLLTATLFAGFVQTANADMLRCKVQKPCAHLKSAFGHCAPGKFSISTSLAQTTVSLYKMVKSADGPVKAVKNSHRTMKTKISTHQHFRAVDVKGENFIDVITMPKQSPNIMVGKMVLDEDYGFNLVCNRAVTY